MTNNIDEEIIKEEMSEKHIPERTCTICKHKAPKESLFRLVEKGNEYVFDEAQKAQSRGVYLCKTKDCLTRLSKHKKIKVSQEELLKMAKLFKEENKNYLNLLQAMRKSQALTFGMNMVLDEIEHIHFIVIASDISDKNDTKIIAKAKELNIPYVIYGTKEQLGEIFSKEEVTVVGINNKKMARGLIN